MNGFKNLLHGLNYLLSVVSGDDLKSWEKLSYLF